MFSGGCQRYLYPGASGACTEEYDGTQGVADKAEIPLVVEPVAYPIDPEYFNPADTFGSEIESYSS